MECNTWKARGHHERVLQAHICVTLSQGEVRTSPLHGCYSALACLSRCISFLDRITMAIRISKPPSACTGVMVSPSTRAASATATIGSKVESVEAVVGPMRLSPAKKVTNAMTVEISAMASTASHPSALPGNVNPCIVAMMAYTPAVEAMIIEVEP